MGQYYLPMCLDSKEYLYSHDCKGLCTCDNGKKIRIGTGLKLMEHSYIGNRLMNAVSNLLIPGGSWYMKRLVWAGDYADKREKYGKDKDGEEMNDYDWADEHFKKLKPKCTFNNRKFRYLTNHTKKEIVDVSRIKKDEDGFRIHPLSLLTCDGNGRGGGDFEGEDIRVGSWARDVISIEDHLIEGYTLVDGQFKEDLTCF